MSMLSKLRELWSGPKLPDVLRPRSERATGSSEPVSRPLNLGSLPPIEGRSEAERSATSSDAPTPAAAGPSEMSPAEPSHVEEMRPVVPPVGDEVPELDETSQPPLSFGASQATRPMSSAGTVALQLLIAAVVCVVVGGVSGWFFGAAAGARKSGEYAVAAKQSADKSDANAAASQKSAEAAETIKEEVEKQVEAVEAARKISIEKAEQSQQSAVKAETAKRAADGYLAQVRQAATQVSNDAKRAADAAASTQKIASNFNIEDFRSSLQADMAKFRAEMQDTLGTDGDHGSFKEELAKFRKEMIKDRATYLKAAEGKSIEIAKYEVRRFASLKKHEQREALRSGQ